LLQFTNPHQQRHKTHRLKITQSGLDENSNTSSTLQEQHRQRHKNFSITLEDARENFHQDIKPEWKDETKKFETERSGEMEIDEPITMEPVDPEDWSSGTRHKTHASPDTKSKKKSLVVLSRKDKDKTMTPLELLRSLAKETPLLDLNSDAPCSSAYSFFDISRRDRTKERLVDYVGKKVRNERYHRERNEMLFHDVTSSPSSSIPRRVALNGLQRSSTQNQESARTRLVRMDHKLGHAVPHISNSSFEFEPREEREPALVSCFFSVCVWTTHTRIRTQNINTDTTWKY